MPRFLVPLVLLVTGLAGLSGCGAVIPLNQFLDVANGFALAPHKSCQVLADEFGLPNIEGLNSPADVGLGYIETHVPVDDQRSLRVWYVPAAESQGVVVLSYGAVGEMTCYLWIVLNLVERGWSVAMYDFSGFGGSTGSPSLLHLLEDGRAAVEWARPFAEDGRVVLMGISLGTIPSITYAAEHPEAVAGIVLDGPISLQAEVGRFGFLLGFRPDDYLALLPSEILVRDQIGQVTRPLLAFTYGRDEFASGAIAADLLANSGGPVQIHRFETLPHVRAPYFAGDEYWPTLAAFLATFARDPENLPEVDLGSPFDFVLPGDRAR